MGIEAICNTIKNLFDTVRAPFPQINRLLLICSMVKRPGLSTIHSVSNVVKDLNKLGIPTGPMPDGSPNMTVAHTFANINEIYRAMRNDASVQAAIDGGSMLFQGTGAGASGPIVVNGTNITTGRGHAAIF